MRTGSAYSYAGVGANETWLYHAGAGTINIGPDGAGAVKIVNNGAERMRIDSSGNVGIGTSSPSYGLHVKNAVDAQAAGQFERTGGAIMRIQPEGFDAKFGTYSNTPLEFMTNSTERMRIDSSGNLLVGTTSTNTVAFPGVTLQPDGQIFAGSSNQQVATFTRQNSDGDIVTFRRDGTTVGSIGTSGNDLSIGTGDLVLKFYDAGPAFIPRKSNDANSDNYADLGNSNNRFKDGYFSGTVNAANFNTTSDATLKTNVETLSGSLDAVKSLRGVSFDWLENGGSEIGVIAQEVEAVLPDVVSTNDQGIKSVKYGNMVALLIEAMKEQQAQIDELKAKLGE
jgi:hypothetical protein